MRLLATKPLELLVKEAQESGEHSLKRTLGPFQLTALGVGAIIGAGIFVLVGPGRSLRRPGPDAVVRDLRAWAARSPGLCYAEFAAMIPLAGSAYTYAYATLGELFAWIIGWDLTLEYAMGASTVSSGWSNHFIELLDIFHIKMPLWLAYDHWTGAANRGKHRRPADGAGVGSEPGPRHAGVPGQGDGRSSAAQSPELVQRAQELLERADIFSAWSIGFNLPAFMIALVITAILVIGIKESARFNATIVVIKVSVVLFVIAMGIRYVNTGQLGARLGVVRAQRLLRHRGRRGLHFLRVYRIRRRLHHRAGSQESAAGLAHRHHHFAAGLHRSLHPRRGGAYRHGAVARNQHRSADRARFSGSRPDHRLARHTVGALAGLTSVMLVMLLGQTRVLYSMANDGLLPTRFFADIHPKFRTPWKNTILVGLLAAIVGSVTPIDDIGKMVNIGRCWRSSSCVSRSWCCAGRTPARRGRSARLGCRSCRSWASCSTAT